MEAIAQENGSLNDRERTLEPLDVARVRRIVRYICTRYNLPHHLKDEYESTGLVAYSECLATFDQNRTKMNFWGYVYLKVRGAVIDFVRVDNCHKRISLEHHLEMRQWAPKAHQIARLLSNVYEGGKLYLYASEVENWCGSDPEEALRRKRIIGFIIRATSKLPCAQRQVIVEHYFHDRRFTEVARDTIKRGKSRVCKIHKAAIRALYKALRSHREDLLMAAS